MPSLLLLLDCFNPLGFAMTKMSSLRALSAKQSSAFATLATGLLQPAGFRNDGEGVVARRSRADEVRRLCEEALGRRGNPVSFIVTANLLSLSSLHKHLSMKQPCASATIAARLLQPLGFAMTGRVSLRGGRGPMKYAVFARRLLADAAIQSLSLLLRTFFLYRLCTST